MSYRNLLISLLISGLGLTLSSQSVARTAPGLPAASHGGVAWLLVALELGPWERYLAHELTPDFQRLEIDDLPRVSWLQLDDRLIIPDFALPLLASRGSDLILSLEHRRAAISLGETAQRQGSLDQQFEQSMLISGVTHRMSDLSALTVSAVLASQRFGRRAGVQLSEVDRFDPIDHDSVSQPYARSEASHGAGMRLALSRDLFPNLAVEASYQSRIHMSEFASLQGVHGSQAEFDIPSRLNVDLRLEPTASSRLIFGVSQIFYSEVGAFPSRALPARFNALLGDSTSPRFAWDDLTVFNVAWHWDYSKSLAFYADYRTRSQPTPSAGSLASVLGPELAQNAFSAGVATGVGKRSRLYLDAAYAPLEHAFGGNVLGVASDKFDQDLEVSATLSFDF